MTSKELLEISQELFFFEPVWVLKYLYTAGFGLNILIVQPTGLCTVDKPPPSKVKQKTRISLHSYTFLIHRRARRPTAVAAVAAAGGGRGAVGPPAAATEPVAGSKPPVKPIVKTV